MFGYIRIYKPDLLVKEYEWYSGVYCGLCKTLGKKCGAVMRMFLSYDAVFIAILSMSMKEGCAEFKKSHCVVNPLKKCFYCTSDNKSMTFAAVAMTILMYYKLDDNIRDSNNIKKLLYSMVKFFIRRNYKKAKGIYPELDDICSKYIEEQSDIELDENVDIDKACLPTANMVANVFSMLSPKSDQKLVLQQFGFYLGRWVYLMDAIDDLDADRKKNNFNPLISKIKSLEQSKTDFDEKEYKNSLLNLTIAQAVSAYNLLDIIRFKGVLNNIVYKGTAMIQKQIIFDRHKKYRKEG